MKKKNTQKKKVGRQFQKEGLHKRVQENVEEKIKKGKKGRKKKNEREKTATVVARRGRGFITDSDGFYSIPKAKVPGKRRDLRENGKTTQAQSFPSRGGAPLKHVCMFFSYRRIMGRPSRTLLTAFFCPSVSKLKKALRILETFLRAKRVASPYTRVGPVRVVQIKIGTLTSKKVPKGQKLNFEVLSEVFEKL